jgi:hypothetical protein
MKTQIWTPSDWSIRKWQGSHFFKFSAQVPKIDFFNFGCILRFSHSHFDGFQLWNISNDRECFSLQNCLLLMFFEGHLLWEKKSNLKKWGCSFGHQILVWPTNVLSKYEISAWIYMCCSPAHGASFGVLRIKKFDQEVIKLFFTQNRIWYDFI